MCICINEYKMSGSLLTSFFIFKQWIGVENIPKKVTTDFEMGLTNSLEKVFLVDIEYIGCYFRFKQALRRKFKDLKCSDEDQQNHQQRPLRETEEVYYDENGEYAGIANYANNHTEIEEILAELSYENTDTGSKERRRCGLCRQKGHNKKTCKINLEVERQ
jgi:hypothetical protein